MSADSRRRVRRTALVVSATLALSSIGSVTSADAATGGCNRQTKGPFTFSACVNAPNAWTIQADGYIDVKPSGCFDIRIDIRDKYGDMAKKGEWQRACGTGHYMGAQIGFTDYNHNNPWFSEFTIVNGTTSYVVDSPYIG